MVVGERVLERSIDSTLAPIADDWDIFHVHDIGNSTSQRESRGFFGGVLCTVIDYVA